MATQPQPPPKIPIPPLPWWWAWWMVFHFPPIYRVVVFAEDGSVEVIYGWLPRGV